MLRHAGFAIAVAAVLALFTAPGVQKGMRDAFNALTHLSYYPIRDMRRSVVIPPQKLVYRAPDEVSVPVTGKEVVLDRDVAAERLHNPTASSAASIANGDSIFHKLCVPCHGATMAGDGPVAPLFMPPPDLLAQQTRDRKDGFIFSYIRHGGVVMPSYGFQVSAAEAWDLVNYIRHQQQVSPR